MREELKVLPCRLLQAHLRLDARRGNTCGAGAGGGGRARMFCTAFAVTKSRSAAWGVCVGRSPRGGTGAQRMQRLRGGGPAAPTESSCSTALHSATSTHEP